MVKLENEIKALIIDSLLLEDVGIEDIKSQDPLFGEGLGLDSIDALELGLALKKKYNVRLDENLELMFKHFHSVSSLALFVMAQEQKNNE